MEEIIDILDREKIIEDLKEIIHLLSEQQQGKVFALDGGWGYGKTYILEKLEKELELVENEETKDNRYYVFHYNCWQYDYYEEPSIAIVSAMLDKINSETTEKVGIAVKSSWKEAKRVFGEITQDFIKNKIGINLVEIYNHVQDNIDENNKNTFEFDNLFAFKRTLDSTRDRIKEITKYKTIVMVVDELDRCMPAYAIKVLERLHHLFEGIDNVIVLLGIDSKQLEHSVKEIYGNGIETDRYLRKFISFKLSIDIGNIHDQLFNKYSFYFDNFEIDKDVTDIVLELIILSKIDIRNLNKLFEKIYLIHQICFKEKQKGEILIFEMIWSLMRYKIIQSKYENIDIGNLGDMYWIPEIDHTTYAGLDRCISKKTIDYLINLKGDAKSSSMVIWSNLDSRNEKQFRIKDDVNGKAWLYLDRILAHKKTFFFEQKDEYLDAFEKCSKFCEIGNTLF